MYIFFSPNSMIDKSAYVTHMKGTKGEVIICLKIYKDRTAYSGEKEIQTYNK